MTAVMQVSMGPTSTECNDEGPTRVIITVFRNVNHVLISITLTISTIVHSVLAVSDLKINNIVSIMYNTPKKSGMKK